MHLIDESISTVFHWSLKNLNQPMLWYSYNTTVRDYVMSKHIKYTKDVYFCKNMAKC